MSIYLDRIYGEHPIGLWSVSDNLTYLTLNSEASEDVSLWTDSFGTAKKYTAFIRDRVPAYPGIGDAYEVTGTTVTDDDGTYVEISLRDIVSAGDLNTAENIDIGFWSFHSGLFSHFEVVPVDINGDIIALQQGEFVPDAPYEPPTEYVPAKIYISGDSWEQIYSMFPTASELSYRQDFGLRVRAYYPEAGTYSFLMGGLSISQGSGSQIILEEGVASYAPPKSTGLRHAAGISYVVPIPEYGFGTDTAYVCDSYNRLLSHNTGIPLVYGDKSATNALTGNFLETPAFVFPGKGVLHMSGINKELSLEVWLRLDWPVDPDYYRTSDKIIGPLWSDDGIYLDSGFLVLRVGGAKVSTELPVDKGPMLININQNPQGVSLMVDGETIGTVPHGVYPDSYGFNTDWIGIYPGWNGTNVDYGPVAVYPYVVTPLIAKRRYVWGQGVQTLTKSDFATFDRTYASYVKTATQDFSLIAKDYVTNTYEQTRMGITEDLTATRSYYRSSIPLSTLSVNGVDAGGRSTSTISTLYLSIGTSYVSGRIFVNVRKSSAQPLDIRNTEIFAEEWPEVEYLVEYDSLPHRISNESVLMLSVKNPHLYTVDIHYDMENDPIFQATVPSVSAFATADNGVWSEVGTKGQLKVSPYEPVGAYYSKYHVTPYMVGQESGSVMNVGRASGITVMDNSVTVSGRNYQTFLGVQLWVKINGNSEDTSMTIKADDGETKFTFQNKWPTSRMGVAETTMETDLTMYQDGHKVSTITMLQNTWTSIGIAFNSPIEMGSSAPTLSFGPGMTVKNIVFYGGDNIAKIMNFRTWAQVLYYNNTSNSWEDWQDSTWQEMYISQSEAPALDIGRQYRSTIGTNKYIVGEDEGVESRTLLVIDDGVSVTAKALLFDGDENVVISTPSWKGLGTFSG